MGIANTLSAAVNVYLLIFALKKKLSKLEFSEVRPQLFQMLGAGILAGILAYGTSYAWENYVGGTTLLKRIGAVFVPIGVASLSYLSTLLFVGVPQAHDIVHLLQAKLKRGGSKT